MNPFKHIGVIGTGKMGSSIFLFLNGFDFRLSWLCNSETSVEYAQKTVFKKTKFLFQSGILSETKYLSKSQNTKITLSVEDLKDCDLIIESITEDEGSKRKLFESLDNIVNANCIFCTNSSSIKPSKLISSENRNDKIAGLHFFFPVALKNTVELITNTSTSIQTKESLHHFLLQINKTPFQQDEPNAFILNRLLLDFQAEAFLILQEGKLTCEEIDKLVKQHLFPTGIFEFFDHVGIDIMLTSIKSYILNAENKTYYYPMIQKLEDLVKLNHLGIKSGKGFYDYTKHEKFLEKLPDETNAKTDYKSIIVERLWDRYMKSVKKIIESGICTSDDLAVYLIDYLGIDSDPFSKR